MDTSDTSSGSAVAYLLVILFSTIGLLLYHPAPPKVIKKNRVNSIEPKFTDKKSNKNKKDAKIENDASEIGSDAEEKTVKMSGKESVASLSDDQYFEKLLADYLDTALVDLKPGSRTDIVIRYYKKSKDADKVYSLKDLGYYIHERPAEGAFSGFGSNALFYGDSVSLMDIQLIAYVLSKAGLKIQAIAPSRYHDAWKAHSVEIGSDTTALRKPVVTLKQLRERLKK